MEAAVISPDPSNKSISNSGGFDLREDGVRVPGWSCKGGKCGTITNRYF